MESVEEPITVENIRCIKCKTKTGNVDVKQIKIECKGKERDRIVAICQECGCKKTRFGNASQPIKEKPMPKPKKNIPTQSQVDKYVKISDLPTLFSKLLNE